MPASSPYTPAAAQDTIVAVAPPAGRGGVGIVRISGPAALAVLTRIFKPFAEGFTAFKPRYLHYGRIVTPRENGQFETIDEGLAVFMPGPHSFTGEDVAELHCHGSPVLLGAAIEAAVAAGSRLAARGEFSYRAFLHGRLDLSQAEAVAELIAAPGPAAARLAQARLGGELGRRIDRVRAALLGLRSQLCLAVDFPDDEVECLAPEEFLAETRGAVKTLEELLIAYERSKIWQGECRVVLAGRVNTGKSSLLNALLGRGRALVSDIPGTTRDYLEETVNLNGLMVRLVDTAGLRETADSVEMQGIEHSRSRIEEADAVLLVVDAQSGLEAPEQELLARLGRGRRPVLVVFNKIDLLDTPPLLPESLHCLAISAKTGAGLDALAGEIRHALLHGRHSHGDSSNNGPGEESPDNALAPNARQAAALSGALDDLRLLMDALQDGIPYDVAAVHLDAAAVALADVTGLAATDDILNRVFSDFCIGK